MKKVDFVHLHNHTHFSVLDGACKIPAMLERAKEYNMNALAMTDHGNMFGTVQFYQKALKAGIKPIIGCEMYVAYGSRWDKEPKGLGGLKKGGANAYHLVLLCKNKTGYQNLMRLTSLAHIEGFYYKPRIDKELLREYHEGLIASSACIQGELARLCLTDQYDKAREVADEYRQIFGDGNYYIEIMNHGIEEELRANEDLIRLSKDLGIPLIATNDTHYLERKHAHAHDALICIQTQKKLTDENRMKMTTEELYFKSYEEMQKAFPNTPEALKNTVEVADKCNLVLEFGENKLPHFPLPDGFDDLNAYLRYQCDEGLKRKYPKVTPGIRERLDFELSVIKKMGFPGYFLITMDFVKEAKRQKVPVGPGRGSAAGSLVSYALDITNVDPLKYDLFFERFLNPHRVTMPDIDIDFSDRGREQIIRYVIDKYGSSNVCQIITFGTMAARGVIRDVARVMDVPYADADRIAKLVPAGPKVKLKDAMAVAEFKELIDGSEQYTELYNTAVALEGLVRNVGTHAAGVVIAPAELDKFVPLYKAGANGEVTTQYDMDGITEVGMLKMDFLGLRTLTVIEDALNNIKGHRREVIDIDTIPLDDKKTFDLFAAGETVGIFQFESSGMRDYLRKLKPTELTDIIAMNALYRPGPMDYIDDYIHRKHGLQEVKYDHPVLEPILKETYGIIVYQEQVMRVVSDMAGFSLAEADTLRRAMGKKKAEIMEEYREKFVKGAAEKKGSKEVANKIFDDMYKFSAYAFNKSHSTGYALVAYQTAWLKAHYPAEFMAANCTSEMENTDRIVILIDECKRMGIKILPPDINESRAEFTVVSKGIRFGLKAIKNVGQGAIDSIIGAREENGKIKTLFDFCEQVDLSAVNKRVIESLILAGAMDSLEGQRWQLMAGIDQALDAAQTIQKDRKRGQTSLFDNGDAKEVFANGHQKLPDVPAWPSSEVLAREKELLGFYVSGHPLEKYADDLKAFSTHGLADVQDLDDGRDIRVGGIILTVNEKIDRKGKPYAFVKIEDFTGSAEALFFSDTYEKFRSLVVKDGLVLLVGKASTREKGNGKIIPGEVIALNQARKKLARRLLISVNTAGLESNIMENLRTLLDQHPGKCQLYFDVVSPHHEKVRMRAGDIRVNPTDKLLKEVKKVVGDENVVIR